MAYETVEGFSLSHVAVLDGSTGAELVDGDIYGVNEASLDPDTDSYDNEGDDAVLSTWYWLNGATLTVQGGYLPMKLVAALTGETIKSSGAGAAQQNEILLWTDRSMNVAPKPVLIRIPARDDSGNPRTLDLVLFKVNFSPITFDGPSYKDGLKINYEGKATYSTKNEAGVLLSTAYSGFPVGGKAVAKALSKP